VTIDRDAADHCGGAASGSAPHCAALHGTGTAAGSNGRRPTIHDVAERAGVSKSLVSLVMRGEPMVREEKRRRVLRAAEELGYAARVKSRSHSTGQCVQTVGVVVADLRNPLLIEVVEKVGSELAGAGVGVGVMVTSAGFLTSSASSQRPAGAGDALKAQHLQALLIVGSVPGLPALVETMSGIPIVVAAAHADGARADVVRNDDHLGLRLVVDYLVACGHRSIAYLGGSRGGTAQDRLAGYRAAMRHHGLTSEMVVAKADFTEDAGYRAAAQLLRGEHSVTAITAVNDLAAIGVLSAAADAGLRVPRDLAVTGYDDSFIAAIRQVSLTSVNQDSAGIGALAARCLLQRMEAPERNVEEHLLPPRLVARFSSGRPDDDHRT
jgi:DNA-binding LacI/PurR family transcriptional regulator